MKTLNIKPYPKPRMTRADKWKKRKCVVNYFAWKDKLKKEVGDCPIPASLTIEFTVAMPPSWSKKKKAEMLGQPHQQRPDLDNYVKAFLDATLEEDGHIWAIQASKVWGEEGQIVFEEWQ